MNCVEYVITLPDHVARAAEAAGLKIPESFETLVREEIRRRQADRLLSIADRVAEAGIPPMTPDEIQAEVDAVRQARRLNAPRS
jgi:hypothetical protein